MSRSTLHTWYFCPFILGKLLKLWQIGWRWFFTCCHRFSSRLRFWLYPSLDLVSSILPSTLKIPNSQSLLLKSIRTTQCYHHHALRYWRGVLRVTSIIGIPPTIAPYKLAWFKSWCLKIFRWDIKVSYRVSWSLMMTFRLDIKLQFNGYSITGIDFCGIHIITSATLQGKDKQPDW